MDADAVWELTEHLSAALQPLRLGQRPTWQELEQLRRDVEAVRAQIRSAGGRMVDLAGLLGEVDSIALEVSKHSTPERLALELIRMKLDGVFKRGSRQEGIAALKGGSVKREV